MKTRIRNRYIKQKNKTVMMKRRDKWMTLRYILKK